MAQMFENAVGGTGSSGNGIQLSVKLDNPKKWDAWKREVVGFANRDVSVYKTAQPCHFLCQRYLLRTKVLVRQKPLNTNTCDE